MPYAAPTLCTSQGCPNLVTSGRCPEHTADARKESDKRRTRSNTYDSRWRAASKAYLLTRPFCESDRCRALPPARRPWATEVDHVDGLGPGGPRGYDETNWRALCRSCHSSKTASSDGGFGNPRKRATP